MWAVDKWTLCAISHPSCIRYSAQFNYPTINIEEKHAPKGRASTKRESRAKTMNKYIHLYSENVVIMQRILGNKWIKIKRVGIFVSWHLMSARWKSANEKSTNWLSWYFYSIVPHQHRESVYYCNLFIVLHGVDTIHVGYLLFTVAIVCKYPIAI